MPGGLDGFTLARLVHETWPSIGIVVASGRTGPAEGEMPPRALFMAKPYGTEALVKAVRSVLAPKPEPILIPIQDVATTAPGAPVLPAAVALAPGPSADGVTGALAQPLQKHPRSERSLRSRCHLARTALTRAARLAQARDE
jgi:hypothetical protein